MAVRLIALDIDGTCWIATGSFLKPTAPPSPRRPAGESKSRSLRAALRLCYDRSPSARFHSDHVVSNGALIRSKEGHTHLRHLLAMQTAEQVLHLTIEWREGAAVIFDRQRENQLMLESLDPDDSLRYAY